MENDHRFCLKSKVNFDSGAMQSAMIVIKNTLGNLPEPLRLGGKEHKKRETSAIFQHGKDSGHRMDIENVTILETEPHQIKRKVKESIQIRRKKPQLNINKGYMIFLQFFSQFDHDLHGNQ